jgi:hypothetical protein
VRSRPAFASTWALAATLVASGCELATHAFDFRVQPAPTATGLCLACSGNADVERPPCPPAATQAPRADQTFVFAARRSRLGTARDLASPRFNLGFDLDCSTRPGGLPVLCAPRSTTGWQPLPRGIDDALLQRALAPAYSAMPHDRAIDLDTEVSGALEHGRWGVLVRVSGWNGGPDDPEVEVAIHTSPGLVGGSAPDWSGADTWVPYVDVDAEGLRPFALDGLVGYVTGGTLVVDATGRGAQLFRFGPQSSAFTLLVTDLSFAGAITPRGISGLTATGIIEGDSAADAATALRAAVGPCAHGALGALLDGVRPLLSTAPDMPFAQDADPSASCDGISFGWALDAEPALLATAPGDDGQSHGPACN